MSTIPPDSDSDNLFSHLLDYQQSEEYKAIADAHLEIEREQQRPHTRKGQRVYRKRHPDLVAMRQQAQKHKAYLFERQHGLCRWCGEPLDEDYQIDHIKALINGGSNSLRNLCVCHPRCNLKKGTKTVKR